MAVPGAEAELIAGGVEDRTLERGDWAQNIWRPEGAGFLSVRSGFGQLAQLDTTLANLSDVFKGANPVPFSPGLQKHLGSHSIQTEFGTTQVLSVFQTRSSSGEGVAGASANTANRWGTYFSVSIHDVDTSSTYEEVLHNHTSQNKSSTNTASSNPQGWYGCYETNEGMDRQSFIRGLDSEFFFLSFQGGILFGNEFTGIMSYFPVDIREKKQAQVESAQQNDWVNGRSESSLITRLVAVDGVFNEGFVYRNSSGLPAIQAIASMGSRFVVAGKNELFFSDPGTPNSFMADNYLSIPTASKITAMSQVLDNLMIFTETETFFYQPSVGANASLGFLVTVSKTVGCLSQSSVYTTGSGTFWVASDGIYQSTNGTSFEEISRPIGTFFSSGITSPLNHYLTTSGVADPTVDDQPTTLYRYEPGGSVSLVFWHEQAALIACFSKSNTAWVYSGGEWSVWPFESSVSVTGVTASVGITKNITNPFVTQGGNRLFLTGSVDVENVNDAITGESVDSSSYYLLEYGRGGGLDRSIKDEDTREVMGYWKLASGVATNANRFYIGKPSYNSNTELYEIPVDLVGDASTINPTDFDLSFDWDDSKFTFKPSGLVPTERLNNSANYSLTLTANPGKDNLAIAFAAPAVTNTASNQRNPWFTLTGLPVGGIFWGYGASNILARVYNGAVATQCAVYIWQSYWGTLNSDDSKAQPVDWAYKGQQVSENGAQLQGRGLFTSMISHGTAQSELSTGWLWGVYNTLLGSDWKGWSSQVIDFTPPTAGALPGNIESITNKLTIRSRFFTTTPETRTFNGAPKYGDYLIDDEEFDTMATSDSTRGETISYMMFGFIRNKAESLKIKSSKMLLRVKSKARRRVGR